MFRCKEDIKWEKRHIKDIRGNEFDIWIFYKKERMHKKQLCVCETEEQFIQTKKFYGIE